MHDCISNYMWLVKRGPPNHLSITLPHAHTHTHTHRLDGKHVVFGTVLDGTDVVDAMERVGSDSGKTSKEVTISDCGQL